jgi:hypothetical protein
MPSFDFHSLLAHLSAHPHITIAAAFLAAFLEAFAVIGTVIPGSSVVFIAGILVGIGPVNLWWVLAAAILGDTLKPKEARSFRYYRDRRDASRANATPFPLAEKTSKFDALFSTFACRHRVFVSELKGIFVFIQLGTRLALQIAGGRVRRSTSITLHNTQIQLKRDRRI